MTKRFKQSGFSLTEVLMAAGILAVGFMLILGLFPVSVQMTAKATERTMGSVASEEAFAKIQLYGVDASKARQDMFIRFDMPGEDDDDLDLLNLDSPDSLERFYPSDEDAGRDDLKYCWSALGKVVGADPNDDYEIEFIDYYKNDVRSNTSVLMTVFVCRKASVEAEYIEPEDNVPTENSDSKDSDYGFPTNGTVDEPTPVRVEVEIDPDTNFEDRLRIERSVGVGSLNYLDLIPKDAVLMNDKTGKLFRVVDSYFDNTYIYLILEKKFDWDNDAASWYHDKGFVWLIPSAEGSDRSSCVGIYQRIMRF